MFQTASQIEKIETRQDKTIKLTVGTQEITPDQASQLFELRQKSGYFLFAERAFDKSQIDIPDFVPTEKNDKTPSQRLRSVLYIMWEQRGKVGTFDDFYKQQVERFIDAVKDKLE
jgi:hypothetical protein|tara:strand:+ start:49 stop:393 length:345 start_codon:yes stop_codon:yes gene_type:complete